MTNDTEEVVHVVIYHHAVLITMATIICISNTLVIMLFMTQASLRSSGNYLLFSLAVSDLAVGLLGIPLNIACETVVTWETCLSSYTCNRFIAMSTVYHILWITLEKYTAIVFPLRHKTQFDQARVKMVIMGTWLGSVLITSIELTWLVDHGDPLTPLSDDVKRKELIYNIFTFVACFLLPIGVMIYAYTSIFLRILRQHSNILRIHLNRTRNGRIPATPRMPKKTKSALLFFAILAIYVMCWFWWFFVTIYSMLFDQNIERPEYVDPMMAIIRYSTSFINPMLYTFFKRDFRKALKKSANGARLSPHRAHRSISMVSDLVASRVSRRGSERVQAVTPS